MGLDRARIACNEFYIAPTLYTMRPGIVVTATIAGPLSFVRSNQLPAHSSLFGRLFERRKINSVYLCEVLTGF